MKLNLLFVEDNDYKRNKILDYLNSSLRSFNIHEARSYTSGVQGIDSCDFDILLLDISLPTFDKTQTESGGRFRTFGGRELARRAIKRFHSAKIIFITQYKSFSDRGTSYSFEALSNQLKIDCGLNFGGVIFFDGAQSSWKDSLTIALGNVANESLDT